MSRTRINQPISGYQPPSEFDDFEKFKKQVLNSPDGKLYYSHQARDSVPGPICDLWQTANEKIIIRINRADGRVDTTAEME